MQAPLSSEKAALETVLPVKFIHVGMSDLLLREILSFVSSFLVVGDYDRNGVYGKSVSQAFIPKSL